MVRTIIIFSSIHHKNTEKLLMRACKDFDIDLVDVVNVVDKDLSDYDYIGFASGIYHGQFHESLFDCLGSIVNFPNKAFLISTSGAGKLKYNKGFADILKSKNVEIVDNFSCKGFDTFGIFKIIGGISKKHPNNKDVEELKSFLFNITSEQVFFSKNNKHGPYFEFQKGNFYIKEKYWLKSSLFMYIDIFDELELYKLFQEVLDFNYFGPNKISKEQWSRIKNISANFSAESQAAIIEADEWVKKCCSTEEFFSINGI